MQNQIRFLSVADVLVIHADTISIEGGLGGIRDPGLLESAVAMPQQQFGGTYLHEGLAEMAAAYLFHIAANHPFLDGNKRAAAMSTLLFLDANGTGLLPEANEMEAITLRVAAGEMSKQELTLWMRHQLLRE